VSGQLAAQRFGGRDQQVAQLAEAGTLGVDCAFAGGHQRLQRLAFTASPRRRRPLLCEHAAGRTDSVERVGLAARAPLPPQPAHLEHPLTAAGTERTSSLNSERAPTCCVLVDELEGVCVPLVTRGDVRLEHDRAADHVHDRERVCVAVRVDTNHVVQLICEHPLTDLQPKRWGTHPVSVWGGNRGRQNCDGSRAQDVDRLLIRPASGRQADTGLSARTDHWKDTHR
jgi:hypothetical protein